nr:hypothetical protein [Candidatus Sigynarchaeota archaeon]
MKRRSLAFLFLAALIAETAINIPWSIERGDPYARLIPRERPRVGAWSWAFYRQSNDEIIAHALEFRLNFLFMSLPTDLSNGTTRSKVVDIIAKCAANDIELYWMTCEDFAPYFNHSACLLLITRVLDFLDAENVKIPGIHLDLEPDISGDYEARSAKFNDYLLLLSEIKALMDARLGTNRTVTLSAAICNCYHDPVNIANGSATIMHQYLDFLVPMTYYCDNAYAYRELIDPLIQLAPVIIGAGFSTFDNFASMLRAFNNTAAMYQDNANFLGFSIFHDEMLVEKDH